MERSITTIRFRLRKTSLALLVACIALSSAVMPTARAADDGADRKRDKYLQLFVTLPYLELRTGPGRGYPVTQVAARDESVDVLKRKTDWFKVRTERGTEGWARATDMARLQLADGTPFKVDFGDLEGFARHRWELGIMAGDYGGATLIGGHLAYSLNDSLKIDFAASKFLGNATNGQKFELGLNHVFLPNRRWSPFFELGTGIVEIQPRVTLVAPIDRTDQTAYVGAGMRFYISRRFFLRGEYRWNTVFTSRDDNEEIKEWKLGLAAFF